MLRNLLGYLRIALESFGIVRRPEAPVSIISYSEASISYKEPLMFRTECGNASDWMPMLMSFGPAHRIPDPFDEPPQPIIFPSIFGWQEQPVWVDDEHGIGANDSWDIEAWTLKVTGGKVGFRELLDAGFDFGPEFQNMLWMPAEDPFSKLLDNLADIPTSVPDVDEFINSLFPLES